MNLQNLPWWGRMLLFVVLGLAVIYIGYQVYPGFSKMARANAGQQAELDRLNAEIQKGAGAIKRRAELEQQIQAKEAELALLRRILPTEPEIGDLVKWLGAQADQVNVDLRTFTRGAVTPKEFYKEYSTNMEARGEYHDLGEFFERVSGHDRLVNIKNLAIGANTGPDRFTKSIHATFTAVTFVYQEEGAK
jgi:type IV pilus assembly protein PilO